MFSSKKALIMMVLALLLGLIPSYADSQLTSGQKLQEYNLITGSAKGLMEDQILTRAEMAVILSELMGQKSEAMSYQFPANFTDVSGHWAKAYIAYGQDKEWFGGYPDGSYRPDMSVSTKDLSSYILNALGYGDSDYQYDNAEFYLKSLGITFDKHQVLKRGQAFDIIWQAIQMPKKGEVVPLGVSLGRLSYDDLDKTYDEALKVVSFKAMNLFEYQLTFNQPVNKALAENSLFYTIQSSTSPAVTSAKGEYLLSEDGKIVTIYLPWVNQNDRLTLTVDGLKSLDGTQVIEDVTVTTTASDRIPPQILDTEVIGSRVVRMTFSEAIKLSNEDITSSFNAGDLTSATSVTYPVIQGQKYHVADVTFNSNFPTNALMNLTVDPISDDAGLKTPKQTFSLDVKSNRVAPEVIGYELIDRNRLSLIWSKPITLNTNDASLFYHTNEVNKANAVSMRSGTNNQTVLYFSQYSLPLNEGYIYVKGGAVKDLWNNRNAFSMTQFKFDLADLIPVPQRIDVLDSQHIKVTFSTPINETHETSTSNFILYKEGKELVAPMSLSFDTFDKNSVTIQFSNELKGDYSLVIEGVKHYDLPSEKATLDFTID